MSTTRCLKDERDIILTQLFFFIEPLKVFTEISLWKIIDKLLIDFVWAPNFVPFSLVLILFCCQSSHVCVKCEQLSREAKKLRKRPKERRKEAVPGIFKEHDQCCTCRSCHSSMAMLIFKKIFIQCHKSNNGCATNNLLKLVYVPVGIGSRHFVL